MGVACRAPQARMQSYEIADSSRYGEKHGEKFAPARPGIWAASRNQFESRYRSVSDGAGCYTAAVQGIFVEVSDERFERAVAACRNNLLPSLGGFSCSVCCCFLFILFLGQFDGCILPPFLRRAAQEGRQY